MPGGRSRSGRKPCARPRPRAFRCTIAGAGTGVTGGARAVRRLGALAREIHAAGGSRRATPSRAPASCCAIVHAAARASRPVLSARSHRDRGLHRRQHRQQRQRLAQLPLRRHAALGGAAARGPRRRPRSRCRPRRADRFRPRHRSRCPAVTKNTAGYLLRPGMDWVDLFVGTEGTLGVVTEATLRLLPAPTAVLAGVVFFPSDDAAIDAVEAWRATRRAAHARVLRPALARPAAPRFPRFRPRPAPRSSSSRNWQSEDDPEIDAGWNASKRRRRAGRGFLVRHHGRRSRALPPLPPHACRNWSTTRCAAAAP